MNRVLWVSALFALTLLGEFQQPKIASAQRPASAAQTKRLTEAIAETEQAMKLNREGNPGGAIELLKRVLQTHREELGPRSQGAAVSLSNIGFVYSTSGDYVAARQYYDQALAIRKEVLGLKHADTLASFNNLGSLLFSQGDYASARPYFEQALATRKETLGPEHPDTALSLNNLGALLRAMGDLPGARKHYEQVLSIRNKILGAKHADTALSHNNLAAVLESQGEFAAAREHYDQALSIYKAVLSPKDAQVATTLNNIGVLLERQADLAGARPYYQQALALHRENLGDRHPKTAHSLATLAALDAAMEDWPAARQGFTDSRRVVRRHMARVLPGLSEKEQLIFLTQTDQKPLHVALTLGLLRRDDPAIAEASATWLLNRKGVAQETLAARPLLDRDASNPAVAAAATELKAARQELSALTNVAPKGEAATRHRQQLATVQQREQEAARKLGQARGQVDIADPWIELKAVRSALPADCVLVDIGRIRPANYKSKGNEEAFGPSRYVAWVSGRKGETAVVDLGAADVIESGVLAFQTAMQATSGSRGGKSSIEELGEPAAERKLNTSLRPLAQLALDPLLPYVKDAAQIVLSPDAALWLVPWAALPLDDGTYAAEKFRFRYVVSGRDLVPATAAAKPAFQPPRVFADPDYDLSPTEVQAATRAILQPVPNNPLAVRAVEGRRSSGLLPQVQRLPGTAAEAAAIRPNLQSYAKAAPLVYTGKQALEGVFKKVESPQVLVLSTHGYFLPDQEPPAAEKSTTANSSAASTRKEITPENPLLRCGLLLTGCNRREGDTKGQIDDGILTGLEIIGCKLNGTELVVLSACETGLGVVNNGEGVAGLRQAFQLAGAKSVVSTLWQIPDRQSAQLMTDFFANLAAGQSKSEALSGAQLSMIKARRERFGAAHPFYWAAFTVTGD